MELFGINDWVSTNPLEVFLYAFWTNFTKRFDLVQSREARDRLREQIKLNALLPENIPCIFPRATVKNLTVTVLQRRHRDRPSIFVRRFLVSSILAIASLQPVTEKAAMSARL